MSNTHTDLSIVAVSAAPSPATSGTTIGVTDANAAYLPDVYPWYALIKPANAKPTRSNSEIVLVTAGSSSAGTTTYTITRAQGVPVTTARSVIVGDEIMEVHAAQHQSNIDATQNSSMARQAIINGNFDVWQRGVTVTSPASASFLSDRWRTGYSLDGGTDPTLVHSRQALTPGELANSYYFYRIAPNGAGSSYGNSSLHTLAQFVENGTRFLCGSGKKITLSFYARSSIANKRIAMQIAQGYGTGGSPTADEELTGEIITLTSSWVKYTKTFTTNTLTGKTFGTDNNDALRVRFWTQWGTTTATTYFGGGTAESFIGSGNIDIAQVQLCAGDVALPFQPKSYEEEFRACQRYFEKSYDHETAPGAVTSLGGVEMQFTSTTSPIWTSVKFCVNKRIIPTIHLYDIAGTIDKVYKGANGKTAATGYIGKTSFAGGTNDATSTTEMIFCWTAEAEL